MRVMAGDAAHPPFLDRMMELEAELGILIEVALEAGLRILAGIDDQLGVTPGIDVQTAGAVATLAAFPLDARAFAGDLDARMLGELEVLDFLLVAQRALIHADVFGAGNHRRSQDHPIHRRAGDDQGSQGGGGNGCARHRD